MSDIIPEIIGRLEALEAKVGMNAQPLATTESVSDAQGSTDTPQLQQPRATSGSASTFGDETPTA